MSILFKIKIESVVGPTVRARFEVCQPDQWKVPATKTAALLTVLEAFEAMKNGYFHGPGQPIRKREAASLAETHPMAATLAEWWNLGWRSQPRA